MARFHVYRLKSAGVLLLDLQAELHDGLPSRVMVPLYPVDDMPWSISRLNPRFLIGNIPHVMATQRMAAVDKREIGDMVADLSSFSDIIILATDFLFQGF